uniref:Uncharacterized protein K02A2.6 n=2 Tax=Cacopsylla melanoneura TaxID=428564 RepID=A0A8D8RVJ8_9HEMI
MPHELPEYPFQRLCLDIMTFRSKDFLVVMDSYSKWVEIFKLNSKKCLEIVSKLKLLFASYGVPNIIVSDNSPFNSAEVHAFCKMYNIEWKTSSPHFPQSNGQSEIAVKISKDILRKAHLLNRDYVDLLAEYRATPIPSLGYSPSEIMMGRLIKTKILINNDNLQPIKNLGIMHDELKKKMLEKQERTKAYFDKKCKIEKPFIEKENVLIRDKDKWVKGQILNQTKYPRSYDVQLQSGSVVRRNTFHLKHTNIMFRQEQTDNFDDFFDRKGGKRVNNEIEVEIQPPILQEEGSNPRNDNEINISLDLTGRPHNNQLVSDPETSFESVSSEPPVNHDHDYTVVPNNNNIGRPKRNVTQPIRLFDYVVSLD